MAARHIVILVENLPVPFDRRPWQIAHTLVAAGHRVSVICPAMYEHTARRERIDGIDIWRYPSREGATPVGWIREYLNALFWMLLICLRLFFTRGIDVIHACNPPDLLFLVAWPFKVFFGTRFLFDHHDLNPEVYLAKFGRRDIVYRALGACERLTFGLADVSLATNESFKRIAVARDGMDPGRIFVVRNAPVRGRLIAGPARNELRRGRRHLVAYLGMMNKQDGVDLLLEAARHIIYTLGRGDVGFALIGDGTELANLKAMAQQSGLADHVRFAGRISDGRALSDYLNTASVCVCPDPKNEMNDHSTMTKVVEYLSLGRPVVAFDLHETLFTAGDTALYAHDNDPIQFARAIVRLLDDPALRGDLGRRGRERFDAMLSWERSEESLLAAYAKLGA
jgi:glycosyltransferase involved in cell wall biosynthesis